MALQPLSKQYINIDSICQYGYGRSVRQFHDCPVDDWRKLGRSRPIFDNLTGLTNLGIHMSLSSHSNDPPSFPHSTLSPHSPTSLSLHSPSNQSCLAIIRKCSIPTSARNPDLTAPSDLVMCRKQPGIAIGRLCDKCDGKCPVCDSYVRPTTLVRICDECSFGNYQNKCVVCGGEVSSSPLRVKTDFEECMLTFGFVGNFGRVLLL